MRAILKLATLTLLTILSLGTWLDPYWWFRLVHEGQYNEIELWQEPVLFFFQVFSFQLFLAIAMVISVLALQDSPVPQKLRSTFASIWGQCIIGRRYWVVLAVLIATIGVGIATAARRSGSEQDAMSKMRDVQQRLQQ